MKKILLMIVCMSLMATVQAQNPSLTKEKVLSMTIEELSDLPLEDLMYAVELLEVKSIDELFEMIMNKNVSSASKKEEDSFRSPLSTTVLTRAELRQYGITTIEEAFRLIPGMIVQEKTNGIYDIHMRGLNNIPDNQMLLYTENNNTLIMIDGRIVHDYAAGASSFEWLPISIEDIERIEVVRGACAALYGVNANNGVINIITEKPNAGSKVVSGSIQMGNHGTSIGDVALRKQVSSKLGLGVTANLQLRERPTNKLYVIPASGIYLAKDENSPAADTQLSKQEVGALIYSGQLTDISAGGYYSLAECERIKQLYPNTDSTYQIFDGFEPETPLESMFFNPERSRKSLGINGYVSYTPTDRIRLDITGGYQQSFIMTTPSGDDYVSFNERVSKTGYGNIAADIYGLNLIANVNGGSFDYARGVRGFQYTNVAANFSASYDINLGDLAIRPEVSYRYLKAEEGVPSYYDLNGDGEMQDNERRSGFLGGLTGEKANTSTLWAFAPSLRLDYKIGDLRLIGAVRGDKTNIPDKWNTTYQAAVNYAINQNNFIRFVYGSSIRSTNMVQSSFNYTWDRTNLLMPDKITFDGNEDADLASINNFEVGYRWRPADNLLVDAELFYSKSEDYGALHADYSTVYATGDYLAKLFGSAGSVDFTNSAQILGMIQDFTNNLRTKAVIKYKNLPYEVKQLGLSMNIDWIVTPRLIAKFNVNVQKTTIDKYYPYSQSATIVAQLTQAQSDLRTNKDPLMKEIFGGIGGYVTIDGTPTALPDDKKGGNYVSSILHYGDINGLKSQTDFNNYDEAMVNKLTDALMQAYVNGTGLDLRDVSGEDYKITAEQVLPLYYSIKYDIQLDNKNNEFYFGGSSEMPYTLENDHKHKATPTVYGMFGLIWRPIDQLNISAFGNYMAKREYTTRYGTVTLDDRFTVNLKLGYKPTDDFEVFFNAHNLFNTKDREFAYGDEIGGLYTVGINFGF